MTKASTGGDRVEADGKRTAHDSRSLGHNPRTVFQLAAGKRFVMVPHEAARDSRLSFGARGVLAEMLSRPEDWTHAADRIAAGSQKDGRKRVLALMRELETFGYLHRHKVSDGNLVRTITVVSDTSMSTQEWADLLGSADTGPPAGSADTGPPAGSADTGPPAREFPIGSPHIGSPDTGTSDEDGDEDRDEPLPPGAQVTDRARETDGRRNGHKNEPNARRALATLRAQRGLPFTEADLLSLAYEVDPDPWRGYLAIKQASEQTFAGSRDPAAVLRSRLHLGRVVTGHV